MRAPTVAGSLLSGLGLVVATASLAVAGPLDPIVEPVDPIVQPLEPIVAPVLEPVVEPVLEPVEPVVEPVLEPVKPVVEPVSEPVSAPRLSSTTVQSPTTASSAGAPLAQQPAAATTQPAGNPGDGAPAASPPQQSPQQQTTGSTRTLPKPDGGVVETELFRARGVALLQDRADPEVIDLCILIAGSGSDPPRVEPLGEYPVDQLAAAGLVIEDPLVECETVVGGVKQGPQGRLSLTDALAKTGTAAGTMIAAGALMLGVGTRLRLAARRFRVLH